MFKKSPIPYFSRDVEKLSVGSVADRRNIDVGMLVKSECGAEASKGSSE
jgi:hypothetical protein